MLINRNYRRLWLGQAVSQLGDAVFATTILLWVGTILYSGQSYAPAMSSAILVIIAAVTIAVAPLAGVLVDRWDKRRVMLRTDLIRLFLLSALTIVSSVPTPASASWVVTAAIGVTVAVATASTQFFNPARFVLIGDVVPPEHRGRAASYSQASAALSTIVGPALAAPLVVTAGIPWALGINAGSFLVSFIAVRSVDLAEADFPAAMRAPQQRGIGAELLVGLRQVIANRVLLAVLTTGLLVMLGAGTLGALDVYFVSENLHAGTSWFGFLSAASGLGMLAGALVSGILGDRYGHAKIFILGLFGAGGSFLVYSRLEHAAAAVLVIALFGLAAGTLETVTTPVLLEAVPRELLGRVISVFAPTYKLASMLSIAAASSIVGMLPVGSHTTVAGIRLGRIDTVFLVTALMLLVAGCYAGIALRRADDATTAERQRRPHVDQSGTPAS
ncbi:MFS transporter [Longispora sp. NPDC051575]|uniref:MFS transporter n=1 Tax=Longispora sp. NPDC051575 TaxID=3154943 RepID=UPI003418E515